MDLASLRAEIKAWERAFKTEHQRDPIIDDIKALPKIAAKYKLYKKISKEVTSLPAQQEVNGSLPSTPPRRSAPLPGPSSLLPKSRPATHPAVDATPNPFSPSKLSRNCPTLGEPPFPQPKLSGHHSTSSERKQTTPSPSLETLPIENASNADGPFVASAVKKARKRLRGDVISPSPKKARNARHISLGQTDPDGDEQEAPFVDESPVKATSNSKHFQLLFEEGAFQQPNFPKKRVCFSDLPLIPDLFSSKTNVEASSSTKAATRIKLKGQNGRQPPLAKEQIAKLTPYAGKKSDSHVDPPANDSFVADEAVSRSESRKRSNSIDPTKSPSFNDDALLPPSPPATEEPLRNAFNQNSNSNRKKTKLHLANAVDEDVADDDPGVQIIEYDTQTRRSWPWHPADGNFSTEDGGNEALSRTNVAAFDNSPDDALDVVESEVNLPEGLRSLLHISSSHRSAREERALVESLLRGTPGPQDPCGEVWGVGETLESAASTTDEEWAGEGVPWDVAEL